MAEALALKDFNLSASDCPIVQIEGWDARFESSVSPMLGTDLPGSVGETVRHADTLIVRVSPRRLWLTTEAGAKPPQPAIDPELGCSVFLGEGRVRFSLSGARVLEILSSCIAVDWRSPGSAPGRALQTAFHHVPVLVLRTSETGCDMIVPRSFAHSLADWIADSAG
ncbi:sarcosine oxidase subunit gamma family protein [Mesorhizobium sp. B1-1-8]|uniref:sarcosine oxidase subunit gamma family protein n=1 Tax=Mesorhizobium sp. B1-1-8 TaxID=2589976 RepID=UPI001D01E290|nr:sarcosine oxidase subunit gamma family protein [Mesorhizobium sp. B1-1-8]UCI09690.1 sarcosine oxidase subunit gamma [Mesorhizobium sp. B1-1-8]